MMYLWASYEKKKVKKCHGSPTLLPRDINSIKKMDLFQNNQQDELSTHHLQDCRTGESK